MILDGITNNILDSGWLSGALKVIGVIILVSPIIMIWVKQGNKMPFPYTGIREIKRWSTIIFVPCFLLILFIVGISISLIEDQIQSNDWVKTDATVDFAEERQDTCSNTSEGECLISYWTHVEYIYEFDENTYSGNRYTFLSEMNSGHADEYPTGMIFSVFVDPHEPNESLMIKGWSGVWIEVLAVLLIFVLLVILFSASTIMFKIGYLLQSSANKQKAIDARTDWTFFPESSRNSMLSFSVLAFNRAPRILVIVGSTIFLILIITGMWIVITVILLFLLLSLGVWRSFTSGVLREMIDFSKLAGDIKKDIFDGETKTFVVEKNGKEKAVKIKTMNNAWESIISPRFSSGSLYFGLKREKGLHLDFSAWTNGADDFMTLIEKDGTKVINESEYNLDKKGPGPPVYALVDLIQRMSSTSN